ncbi:MAG TPA: cation:proton antiporter [Galbitalea sp.]|nr:cation:proton antiporter [Galbitalea sp.]
MSFSTLILIGVVALLGPLLALPTRWRIPVVIGELIGGVVIGASGFGLVKTSDPTFSFLANLGFGLTMFVAGSNVPLRDARLRPSLLRGLVRAVGVGIVAAILAVIVATVFHTGHAAMYGVLMASSSAVLVLPAVNDLGLGGPKVLPMIAQVAIADTVSIVALPLVIDPARTASAAIGAGIIAAAAVLLYLILRWLRVSGRLHRFHKFSERRHFALELRISLILLFALAAVATDSHISIMLAGFALGLVLAGVAEPRRLASQLFALTDGFLGPLFFVWLGASLSIGALFAHPQFVLLGVALGVGAILAHLAMRIFRQPVPLALMSASQLGVPIAAATIGQQTNILVPGESAALILGGLITIVGLAIGARVAGRTQVDTAAPAKDAPSEPSPPKTASA